ncbi:M81 family metallopeptidase [Fodinicurvata sediminis]|uniref:M81 family metallopeptidase n=1 Tax=Fodinicurvata sediminis TaxID=1121832 RepID=UPI0003B7B1B1|nr:M81 family metallopeptidase [Fodinicurvata sediminis]
MGSRVAIGGLLHETNTFAPTKADYAAFEQGGGYIPMTRGMRLFDVAKGINLGVSGAMAHGREAGWDMIPTLWAGAIPSAHVTRDAYEAIVSEIVEGIAAAGELDGVYLDLHGAMVCEHLDDGEGELLQRVRNVVGDAVPIAASLDLHGNITEKMMSAADVLVGFRTYPHIDMARTGERAAQQLTKIMSEGRRPAKAMRRLPYLVPIPWQCTDLQPGARLYGLVDELEQGDVSSTSLFMGFPAADFPECGPTALAFADSQQAADEAVDRIAEAYRQAEPEYAGTSYEAADGVAKARELLAQGVPRPIVLADTQDNPGAGGDSNTTGMLRALVEAAVPDAAVGLIVDPESAAQAHAAGEGREIELALGGQSNVPGDSPYTARFVVEKLSDGRFTAPGPFYGGAQMDLGPSACLRIGGVRVVVSTHKAQMADREMFRFAGIAPEETDILVVKSSTHFRADFAPIAGQILVCVAPGPMAIDPASLPWRRLTPGLRLSPMGPEYRMQGAEGVG